MWKERKACSPLFLAPDIRYGMRARGHRKVSIEKFAEDERAKTFAIPFRSTSSACSGVRCTHSPFPFILRGFSILNYHSLLLRIFSRIHSRTEASTLLCMLALRVMRKFNTKFAAIAIIHSPSVNRQGLTLLALDSSARNSHRSALHGASTLHHHNKCAPSGRMGLKDMRYGNQFLI